MSGGLLGLGRRGWVGGDTSLLWIGVKLVVARVVWTGMFVGMGW